MDITGLSGGLMLVAAAGLWLVYLMPTWFKRQQLRAAQVPALERGAGLEPSGRVEVVERSRPSDPRELAAQRSRAAQLARTSRNTVVAAQAVLPNASPASSPRAVSPSSESRRPAASSTARRLRRTRALVSLVLLTSIVVLLVQLVLMLLTGVAAGAWTVVGYASVTGVIAFTGLGRLASIARRRSTAVRAPQRVVAQRVERVREAQPAPAEWTPVPLPKPLYMTRADAEPQLRASDPVEELRQAALVAERALRDAHQAPEVWPIRTSTHSGISLFNDMGVVDSADVANTGTDLDAVLRRRRAAAS